MELQRIISKKALYLPWRAERFSLRRRKFARPCPKILIFPFKKQMSVTTMPSMMMT